VLAVLIFIGAAMVLLLALFLIWSLHLALLGIFIFLPLAAGTFALGNGLLKLERWARITTLVIAWAGLVPSVYVVGVHNPTWQMLLELPARDALSLGVTIWAICYLMLPHVREAFAASQARQE